ncbi:prenylated Rab acceptor protein 1 isoform X1 [Cydia pomonella]|uniref:prenylated Rab acceptor protein 1 isoform X1 n=1 Tax=Cydia pomonella TaxID=82600 RepID=UPI002ADDF2F2|nr:prenylated Rab acceptor protein 1 isoform X1 [Cydia pomonella]XP_061710574.1 prenylated Rab acceptor protein 1 isoform X1 [Cydia pomonella]
MSENVNIDLSGEMSATTEKKGFHKYVNDMELLMQHIRSGGGQALLMGFLASRRPWTQFVATENFKVPASLPRLTRRIYRNVEYFQANYFMVFLGLFLYCLITSPFLLIAMVASFFGYRKLTAGPNTWKIGSYELTKTQQYAVAATGSVAICWFAGVGAVVFWVLGATVTIVALHAGLFDAESLPPLEEEQFPMIEQV